MKNDVLYGILHALGDKDRKRLIERVTAEDAAYVTHLLKVYLALDSYEEDAEIYRWQLEFGKHSPKKQLLNARARLKQAVQNFLICNEVSEYASAAERILVLTEVLFKSGYADEAFHDLLVFVKEQEMFAHPVQIVPCYYKLIWLHPLSKEAQKAISRKELMQGLSNAIENLIKFHEVFALNQEVTELYVRNTIMKSDVLRNKVDAFAGHPLFGQSPAQLPYMTAAYLLKSRILIEQLLNNNAQLFETQKELCALMRKEERNHVAGGSYVNYMQEHVNLALLAARAGNREILEMALTLVRKQDIQQKNLQHIFHVQVLFVELLYLYYHDMYDEMQAPLAAFDLELSTHIHIIPPTVSVGLRYGIMKCWLALGAYSKVAKWHAELPIRPQVRADSHYVVRLIYICALYEEARTASPEVFIPSKAFLDAVRTFVSMHTLSKEILPLEYHIHITLIRLTNAKDWLYHVKQFTRLADKMKALIRTGEHYVLQFERMFSLYTWLTKQIREIEVLQKK